MDADVVPEVSVGRVLQARSIFVPPRLLQDSRRRAVVVVEDVITTGASIMKAVRAVEEQGAKVARVVLIVDREEGGAEAIRQQGYDVRALFTRADFRPK